MSIICPACKTNNANDAVVCKQCTAALPTPQRMSLLEQAMAKPFQPEEPPPTKPPTPPVHAPAPVAAAAPAPEAEPPLPLPLPAPAPAPSMAKSPFSMPPLPPQPRPRRRSRAPWVLGVVLFIALLGAIGVTVYEQIKNGPSTTARP